MTRSETGTIAGLYVKAFVGGDSQAMRSINKPCGTMGEARKMFDDYVHTPQCDAVYIYRDGHIVDEWSWARDYDRALEVKEEQAEEDRRDGLID